MRLGINVPNDLLSRVKGIRPQVNVSQICREALEHRVVLNERAIERVQADGMDREASRLAQSVRNQLIEPDWEGMAYDDARDWVSRVNPGDWEFFCENYDTFSQEGLAVTHIYDLIGIMEGKTFWDRWVENREWATNQFRSLGYNYSDLYNNANYDYCRAWFGYVIEVRRKLAELHNSEYDRIMAERANKLLSRQEPEVPLQLK